MFIKFSLKMKLTIPYCSVDKDIAPVINDNGEWFDLVVAENVDFQAPHNAYNTRITQYDTKKVSLGIAMALPKEFEAIVVPRSSLYHKKALTLVNSIGIIDSSYNGDQDIWAAYLKADKQTSLTKGDRIVQFRIQPSQKASIWTKIKWLFVSQIVFKKVESLNNPNRGGYGTSGGYKEVE